MNWKQLISAKRFGMEEFHEERQENRSEFQRDYDRLIFSAPFRRLQNKTQVFPLPGSIFVHNRLTHSLEVSCVGRSLGNDVAKAILERQPELESSFLPEIGSIVSAACLAHDLGNPPFGHSGERAISTFFSEGKGQRLQEKQPDGEQCERLPHPHPPVRRTPQRRIRLNIFNACLHRKIPLFIEPCRQKVQVRLLCQ